MVKEKQKLTKTQQDALLRVFGSKKKIECSKQTGAALERLGLAERKEKTWIKMDRGPRKGCQKRELTDAWYEITETGCEERDRLLLLMDDLVSRLEQAAIVDVCHLERTRDDGSQFARRHGLIEIGEVYFYKLTARGRALLAKKGTK